MHVRFFVVLQRLFFSFALRNCSVVRACSEVRKPTQRDHFRDINIV